MDICPSCNSAFPEVSATGLCPTCEKDNGGLTTSTGTLVAFLVSLIPFFVSLNVGSTRTTTINGVTESTRSGMDYVAVIVGGVALVLGARAFFRARKSQRPKTAKMAGVAMLIGAFHIIKGLLF